MTLNQCYQQNKGKALLIPGGGAGNEGQCAQWADTVLHDVYGQPYLYTPAAIDWWTKFATFPQLKNNFVKVAKGSLIKKGDFIVYDSRVGSQFGHIDVASKDGTLKDFWAYDSNWGRVYNSEGQPILHEVHHNDVYNNYVLGYIRKKGTTMTPQQKKDLALGEKARQDNYQGRLKADQKAILAGIKAHLNDPSFRAEVRKLVK